LANNTLLQGTVPLALNQLVNLVDLLLQGTQIVGDVSFLCEDVDRDVWLVIDHTMNVSCSCCAFIEDYYY